MANVSLNFVNSFRLTTNHGCFSKKTTVFIKNSQRVMGRIGYIALSILTIGIFPLLHRAILPKFKAQRVSAAQGRTESKNLKIKDLFNKLLKKSNPDCHDDLKEIGKLIKNNRIRFNRIFDHHSLHDRVTDISLKVRNQPKFKGIWEKFLQQIHHSQAVCPVNKKVVLDFTAELNYLKKTSKGPGKIKVEKLPPSAPKKEIQQIAQIEKESFGPSAYTAAEILNGLKNPDYSIFVARDEKTKKIQGCVFSRKEQDRRGKWRLHVTSVARKADAAKRGVARQMFSHYQAQVPSEYAVVLEVRETNRAAIKLYSDCGFKKQKTLKGYYSKPKENGYFMIAEPKK